MTQDSPFPRTPRPYWKGYNRKEDENLAEQLFYGTTVRDEKTGRIHHRYLPKNSPHERQGLEALQRLLLFSCEDLAPSILFALLGTLESEGSVWGRLEFKRGKKGRKDPAADYQIDFEVEHSGLKNRSRRKRGDGQIRLVTKSGI
jgi:hypothetical protein